MSRELIDNMKNFSGQSNPRSKLDEIDLTKMKITDSKTAKESVFQETLNYFKLFLTEIRHQDPYNTVETKDMTEQMLNIHLAEQAINTNKNLEKLIELSNNQASYIGKNIQIFKMNEKIIAKLEDGKLNQQFKLPENSSNVDIIIRNADDNIIVKTEKISGKTGMNNFTWDGKDNNNNQLIDGKYIIDISAINDKGKFLDVEVASGGKVESSFKENQDIKLVLDNGEIIKLEEIMSVSAGDNSKEIQKIQLNENLKKLNSYLQNISLNR